MLKYGILPLQRESTRSKMQLNTAERIANMQRFNNKYTCDKTNEDVCMQIIFTEDYCNAYLNAKQFNIEPCLHKRLLTTREQTRSIDEMETLMKICLDCGIVTQK